MHGRRRLQLAAQVNADPTSGRAPFAINASGKRVVYHQLLMQAPVTSVSPLASGAATTDWGSDVLALLYGRVTCTAKCRAEGTTERSA